MARQGSSAPFANGRVIKWMIIRKDKHPIFDSKHFVLEEIRLWVNCQKTDLQSHFTVTVMGPKLPLTAFQWLWSNLIKTYPRHFCCASNSPSNIAARLCLMSALHRDSGNTLPATSSSQCSTSAYWCVRLFPALSPTEERAQYLHPCYLWSSTAGGLQHGFP